MTKRIAETEEKTDGKSLEQGHRPGSELMSQKLYTTLKRDIVTCRIRPGSPLTEAWLCNRYGASRTVVRDACLRLSKDELLGWVPNKGHHVTEITMQDMNEWFELRGILEAGTAELASERARPEQIREAEKLARATYKAGDKQSYVDFLELNHNFHVLLAEMGGNRRLFDQLDHVLIHFARFSYLTMAADSYSASVVQEHCQVLDSIRKGDPKRARQATLEHIRLSKERAVRYFLG